MADPARAKKIADRIKVIVAETLEFRVKDERLGFVTITDVRVTGDLQNASVFYTVFGGETERAETAAALESAKGKLRAAVGKGIGIRLTPTLEFFADALPGHRRAHGGAAARGQGARRRRGRGRQRCRPTRGTSDPYKKPVEDDDGPRRRGRGRHRPRGRRDAPSRRRNDDRWRPARRHRRAARRGQGGRLDQPRRGGQGPRAVRHPSRGPRRHPGPDGDRGARARGQPRHQAPDVPGRLRQDLHRDDPARAVHPHRRRRGRGHRVVRRHVADLRRRRGGGRRADRRHPAGAERRRARSRSTAGGPTPGSGPGRTWSCRPGRSRCTASAVLRLAGRGRGRPRRAGPRRRGRGVLRHLRPGAGARPRRRPGRRWSPHRAATHPRRPVRPGRRPLPGGAAGGEGRRRRTGGAAGGGGARVVRGP